jgi:ATP-dependent RNA helicase RhlE
MELYAPIQQALTDEKYNTPTPIQAQTIPAAIEGKDILGCAQTGTGKTASFAIPILDYIGHEDPALKPKTATALVLAPTRELAIQISESFAVYGKHLQFNQALVYGGVSQNRQVESIRKGVDVLIATPGRLLDLMQQKHIRLDGVQMLVLDEADRMLDMGFLPELKKIIAKLPSERQSLFFSATMPPKIRQLSNDLLRDPVSVNIAPKTTTVKRIEQSVRVVNRNNKVSSLCTILKGKNVDQTIVFTRTKHGANNLVKHLARQGIDAVAIHGNKSQNARQRALTAFRDGKTSVLVATDVAARGIDIDGVSHVVNYDMPVEPESYVHRVGRTGRAGAEGIAVSFCTGDELDELRAIERLIGNKLRIENPEEEFVKEGNSGSSGNRGRFRGGRSGRSGKSRSGNSRSGESRSSWSGSRKKSSSRRTARR